MKNRLQLEFDFIGEQQVRNIAELVRAYRVVAEGTSVSASSARPKHKRVVSKRTVGAAAVVVVLIAAVGIYRQPAKAPAASTVAQLPLTAQRSIAVLPFQNMNGNPDEIY